MGKQEINEIIKNYLIPIKEVLIKENLLSEVDILINNLGFRNKNILLVSDKNIEQIAKQITRNIKQNNIDELILVSPNADEENLNLISQKCKNIDLIVAVGSGTINDLCKYSSFKNNIPYIIFATAPSMNGYASANASILIQGHKKSLKAHQAMAIYFDLDVVSQAPKELIQAGIGDSLCYWTCKFDWMLSHLLLNTYFNNEVFQILSPYQEELLDIGADNLRDKNFINLLCKILLISGFSMYLCKGSYPASQGEHLLAHFLEMKYSNILKKSFHGQQIAVTTLTMLRIQENFLKAKRLELKNKNVNLDYLIELFDGDRQIASQCIKEINNKLILSDNLDKINKNLAKVQRKLQQTTISFNKIIKIYDRFNLFKTPKELGISDKIYEESINNSYLIRDRLTALDFEFL